MSAFICKQKFNFEDLSVATQIFDKGYYLFKFDLKSGYHRIEILLEHRQYLAFAWEFGTRKFRYFQFCVVPFGLSSAPFTFTKILLPLQPLGLTLPSSGYTLCVRVARLWQLTVFQRHGRWKSVQAKDIMLMTI